MNALKIPNQANAADSLWTILYIVLTLLSDEVRFKDLCLPKLETSD